MPEMKHNFLKGKMNKDLDERLVPNGEYRDALNIDVSTSEDSNVGTVQNILGNKLINTYPVTASPATFLPSNAVCVGSISDEANDSLYWFATGDKFQELHYLNGEPQILQTVPFYEKDMILKYKDGDITPVFVDINTVFISNESGNTHNSLAVSSIDNIGKGTTVTGYTDNGTGFVEEFTGIVEDFGEIAASNVGWTPNYDTVQVLNPSANPNNPFSAQIKAIPIPGPTGSFGPSSPPTLLIDAPFPGQTLGIGNVVTGSYINVGTEVVNITYPSSYSGQPGTFNSVIEVELNQSAIAVGPHPWNIQVNFTNPGSTVPQQVLNNVLTIPGAQWGNTPTSLGMQVGMFIVGSGIPQNASIHSIDETTSSTESYITIVFPDGSPAPVTNTSGGVLNVYGSGLLEKVILTKSFQQGNTAVSYPQVDYLVFKSNKVLNFHKDRLITGINIIDDMLFWTDNHSEPKKINIERSIRGTDKDGLHHTHLVNDARDIGIIGEAVPVEEQHITVIRKGPTNAPLLDIETERPKEGVTTITDAFLVPSAGIPLLPEQTTNITINPINNAVFEPGDIVLFQSASAISPLPDNWKVKAELESLISSVSNEWSVKILSIKSTIAAGAQQFDVMQDLAHSERLFKLKFPRFATRYKYEDGEYSVFSPFSEVAFVPSEFRYRPHEGFNVGMENTATKITLKNLIPRNIPDDVVQVDILYKESDASNIYLVDSIKPKDPIPSNKNRNYWNETWYGVSGSGITKGKYEITSEMIHATLPENQLLRPWDNVPTKALAQEITANRLVYGNYWQNYDLTREDGTDFKPEFNVSLKTYSSTLNDKKSVKTQREYQVGVSYFDDYGRETPILTDQSGTLKIKKETSNKVNRLAVQLKGQPPAFAKAYKFYVKESSTEYYNLAMDRYYDDESGFEDNMWLSFYSNDRSKLEEGDWIELKKGSFEEHIKEDAKYKVLAIENEAPEFVKRKRIPLNTEVHNATSNDFFIDDNNLPTQNKLHFDVNGALAAGTSIDELYDITKPLTVRFYDSIQTSKTYKVTRVAAINPSLAGGDSQGNDFRISVEFPFGDDVIFMEDTSGATTTIKDDVACEISLDEYRERAEYEGRFFVKVLKDSNLLTHVVDFDLSSNLYTSVSQSLYYFDTLNIDAGDNTKWLRTAWQSGFLHQSDEGNWWDYLDCYRRWSRYFGDVENASPLGWAPSTVNNVADYEGPKWFIDALPFEAYQPSGTDYDGGTDGPNEPHMAWSHPLVGSMAPSTVNMIDIPTDNIFGDPVNGNVSATEIKQNDEYLKHFGGVDHTFTLPPGSHGAITISYIGIPNEMASVKINSFGEANAMRHGLTDHNDNPGWNQAFMVGDMANAFTSSENDIVTKLLTPGQRFKFTSDPNGTIYTKTSHKQYQIYNFVNADNGKVGRWEHGGLEAIEDWSGDAWQWDSGIPGVINEVGFGSQGIVLNDPADQIINPLFAQTRWTCVLFLDKPVGWHPKNDGGADHDTPTTIEFLDIEPNENKEKILNPVIWETEPKPSTDIDLYYEASNVIPITMDLDWNEQVLPLGSTVECIYGGDLDAAFDTNSSSNTFGQELDVILTNIHGGRIMLANANASNNLTLNDNALLKFWNGNEYITVAVEGSQTGQFQGIAIINIDPNFYNGSRTLNWYNCFSFGNGVESNRVRDDFNQVIIDNGPRASTTSILPYEAENRKYGIIYSGLYNSQSGVNDLNQFRSAEKITKDINPTYGSIQKLFTRRTSLVTFCEDRVVRITSDKDKLYNVKFVDHMGNTPETVLGDAQPFIGDFGIGKNPESFASESYRAYFTDKKRGSVLRLSKDGLTPISDSGMNDWFNDNLKLGNTILGSYDDDKLEYNLTIKTDNPETTKTISYSEAVSGWVSFKSFIPENGISLGGDYYTFDKGQLYKHHMPLQYNGVNWVDVDEENAKNYNVFYGVDSYESYVEPIFNGNPSVIKSYKTLSYEGSQSKIDKFTIESGFQDSAGNTFDIGDGEFYNLQDNVKGWYVQNIVTDQQEGSVKEFIEKEGKWFNYIIGKPKNENIIDPEEFSFQGIGIGISSVVGDVVGCMDANAFNFNPMANVACAACCIDTVPGCMDSTASNYNSVANVDDGSCIHTGCTDPTMFNYNPSATVDDGSCVAFIYGCTDPTMSNYDPTANTLDGSCVPFIYGCIDATALNYNSTANTDDGSCVYCVYGCTDSNYAEYNPLATCDNGTCATLISTVTGCMDQTAIDYDPIFTHDCSGVLGGTDYSCCTYCVYGCTDPLATNYDPSATCDDGTCITSIPGCTDPTATNYDPNANVDDGSCVICSNLDMTAVITVINDTNSSPSSGNGQINFVPNQTNQDNPWTLSLNPAHGGFGNWDDYTWVNANSANSPYTITATTANGCTETYSVNVGLDADGCMDPAANNFSAIATNDDGSCTYSGCTDPLSNNGVTTFTHPVDGLTYLATTDDGSCVYTSGCTDPAAANYDPLANQDDGSCLYDGCTDPTASNYDPLANQDDGSCEYWGCTDPNNSAYSSSFTHNCDGTAIGTTLPGWDDCCASCFDSFGNPIPNYSLNTGASQLSTTYSLLNGKLHVNPGSNNSFSWTGVDSQSGTVNIANPTSHVIDNLPPGDYTVVVTNINGCVDSSTWTITEDTYGCTDSTATNYDPNANVDDGSCIYPVNGCTDPNAQNYDPLATVDDGSCISCDGVSLSGLAYVSQHASIYASSNVNMNNVIGSGFTPGGCNGVVGAHCDPEVTVPYLNNGIAGQGYVVKASVPANHPSHPNHPGQDLTPPSAAWLWSAWQSGSSVMPQTFGLSPAFASNGTGASYEENNFFQNDLIVNLKLNNTQSPNFIPACDSRNLSVMVDVYGCMDNTSVDENDKDYITLGQSTGAWNYDSAVNNPQNSASDTTNVCLKCSDHTMSFSSTPVLGNGINADNTCTAGAGSGDGAYNVTFDFGADFNYFNQSVIHLEITGASGNAATSGYNQDHWYNDPIAGPNSVSQTMNYSDTALDCGIYEFTWTWSKEYTDLTGNTNTRTCQKTFTIEIPAG
tara:strand:- start:13151 stop:22231 length:9081 start_codon:yes stop_codon:yes gene_type:complete